MIVKTKYISIIYALISFFIVSCVENTADSTRQNKMKKIKKEVSENDSSCSDLTCPHCGFKENILMPTESCLIRHTCNNCKKDIYPKEGDCCVFCTYGTVKCPSKQ